MISLSFNVLNLNFILKFQDSVKKKTRYLIYWFWLLFCNVARQINLDTISLLLVFKTFFSFLLLGFWVSGRAYDVSTLMGVVSTTLFDQKILSNTFLLILILFIVSIVCAKVGLKAHSSQPKRGNRK